MTTETRSGRPAEGCNVDVAKREFMAKFGKYAATAPLGMYLLMTPAASQAQASGTTCQVTGSFKCDPYSVKYSAIGTPEYTKGTLDVNGLLYSDTVVVTKFSNGTYVVESQKFGVIDNPPSWMDNLIDRFFNEIGC